jgi:ring-1,2-phenylacetyl-CoA epoxidase subunit PaaC
VTAELVEGCLRVGDDALVAAQRLAQWSARAPEMEEDIALSNIALDQLGVARLLLSYAGAVEGHGRDEDALAYLREPADFRNCLLVEQPNGDFGVTMAKLLFLSVYQHLLYQHLMDSVDERLADVGARARKESAYHEDHATQWTVRLGDGTDESHRRMQAAVDQVWPYTDELFAVDEVSGRLAAAGLAPDPESLRRPWLETVGDVLAVATLTRPAVAPAAGGGRAGRHTAHLSTLLSELQALHRSHPGATW